MTTTSAPAPVSLTGCARFVSWDGHRLLALLARLYLAYVFLLACWHKIHDPAMFAVDVATYQIVPLVLINFFALMLPWLELVVGVQLLVGFRVQAAALLVAGMMVMFMVALSIALARGLDMSCGCFASMGAEEDPISILTLLRDAGWLALAVYVFLLDRRPLGVDGLLQRRAAAAAAV